MKIKTLVAFTLSVLVCASVFWFVAGYMAEANDSTGAEMSESKAVNMPRNIVQIGLVVRDIEKASKAYAKIFGMEVPEPIITEPEEKAGTRYEGEPTQAQAKLVFLEFDNLQIELIEPIGGPSTWQRFLDEKGEGVHHIAFTVKNTDNYLAALADQGLEVEQEGRWTEGSGGRYTYINSEADLSVVLELLESF